MDAEQRHALKTNELGETLMKAREWGEKWLNHILIGVIVIALAVIGYRWWNSSRESARKTAWSELSKADTDDTTAGEAPLDQLRKVIADAPDPAVRTLARIRLAEALVSRSLEKDSEARLNEAARELKLAYDDSTTPNLLKAAVLYQQAQVFESRRDFEAARAAYGTLQSDARFEGSPFRSIAEGCLKDLNEISAKVEFKPGAPPPPVAPPADLAPPPIPHSAPATQAAPSDAAKPESPSPATEKPEGEAPAEASPAKP
jgi:predicted negative regulator of RcsB-dependent stress response